jgi:hypothetical protein
VDAVHVDAVVVDLPEDRTALAIASEAGHLVLRAQRARTVGQLPCRVPYGFAGYLVADQKDPAMTVATGVGVHAEGSLGSGA